MFEVKRHDNEKATYTVYAVKDNPYGSLMFLVFTVGRWMWIPASEYVPIDFKAKQGTKT